MNFKTQDGANGRKKKEIAISSDSPQHGVFSRDGGLFALILERLAETHHLGDFPQEVHQQLSCQGQTSSTFPLILCVVSLWDAFAVHPHSALSAIFRVHA